MKTYKMEAGADGRLIEKNAPDKIAELEADVDKLNDRMKWLKSRGCYPSISRRGDMWRAHVNVAGNFWANARTPCAALEDAVKRWQEKGYPKEGRSVR